MRPRLFTPGPTQIPEKVRATANQALIYHRGTQFKKIFQEVLEDLKYLFQTEKDVIVLTSSGTGGMEACVCNLLNTQQKAIVITGGKFGERWADLCQAYGIETIILDVPWGQSVDINKLEKLISETSNLGAVLCTHSETSTGAVHNVEKIAKIVHDKSDALCIVDGITAVGVLPFHFDELGIDACVAGSQKGVMVPPGLAFVALSERAWQKHEQSDLPRYYFDFSKAHAAAQAGNTSWTPAISMILALSESLRLIRQNGLEHYWNHYACHSHITRLAIQALGLELFAQNPSNALTAVKVPEGIDGIQLIKAFQSKFAMTVAGGQAKLKGKIFRVTHMGDYDYLDSVGMMAATEMVLKQLGWKFDLGIGLATMQKAYDRWLEKESL